MPRFLVEGADRYSGRDRREYVIAADEVQAEVSARNTGMLISSITLDETYERPAGKRQLQATAQSKPTMTNDEKTKAVATIIAVVLFLTCGTMVWRSCDSLAESGREAMQEKRRQDRVTYADDGKQAQRGVLIDDMIANGLFHRVDPAGTRIDVQVGLPFYAMTIDEKRDLINVIFAYYSIDRQSPVRIRLIDMHTGNKVGSYDEDFGLRIDQ